MQKRNGSLGVVARRRIHGPQLRLHLRQRRLVLCQDAARRTQLRQLGEEAGAVTAAAARQRACGLESRDSRPPGHCSGPCSLCKQSLLGATIPVCVWMLHHAVL